MPHTHIGEPPVQAASAPASWSIRWRPLAWLLALVVAAGILQAGLDWAVHRPNAARKLTARLAAAFGRPVKVSRYDVTLWPGPRLLAQSVVVAEDPRFGNEYFLRADSLVVSPRLLPLLRGRIAVATLSFDHPSLNLAMNPNGRVNLADWLPRPDGGRVAFRGAPSFMRVSLSAGRINFKSGDVKLPFALTVVNGFIEQQAGGRWRISLDAQPMRAAVILQRVGTLHLEGTVGGTTSRLRPADLQANWSDGSVADLLRFLRGDDMGARGDFSLELAAHAAGQQWNLSGKGQARRLHRWDLPLRADNPGFNLTADGVWLPETGELRISSARLAAPHSNGTLTGSFGWRSGRQTTMEHPNEGNVTLSAAINAPDVLAFLRGFRAGIAEQLTARGEVLVSARASGWPLELETARIVTQGMALEGGSLAAPLRLGPANLAFSDGKWSLPETQMVFQPNAGIFSFQIPPKEGKAPQPPLEIFGQADDARQILAVTTALGYSLPDGWDVSGPVAGTGEVPLQHKTALGQPSGKFTMNEATARVPFLVRPIGPATAELDFSPEGQILHVDHAEAFGSNWKGELTHERGSPAWHGNLSADTVDVARFNDFLNPAKRQSLLARILPYLAPASAPVSVPESLHWSGRLQVGDFQFQRLHLTHLRTNARVDRRVVELDDAEADLGRGHIAGSFMAHLNAQPGYQTELRLRDVDLATFFSPSLAERVQGMVTGEVKLSAEGLTRGALIGSLRCEGQAEASGLTLKLAGAPKSDENGNWPDGPGYFPLATTDFRCDQQRINFAGIKLLDGHSETTGEGSAGFDRSLDFKLVESRAPDAGERKTGRERKPEIPPPVSEPRGEIHLTGTLEAPNIKVNPASPRP
jgi:hypothetical protein